VTTKDTRPANCRDRLQDEGKSGRQAGGSLTPGMGRRMTGDLSKPLTKDGIRGVPCPVCLVGENADCIHKGKGASKKNRNRTNHLERMELAQQVRDIEMVDMEGKAVEHQPAWYRNLVIDYDDPFMWGGE